MQVALAGNVAVLAVIWCCIRRSAVRKSSEGREVLPMTDANDNWSAIYTTDLHASRWSSSFYKARFSLDLGVLVAAKSFCD
jgi:hypothetical protein